MSTTPKLIIEKLTVDSIEEFNRDDTLYIVDFRATGESLSHEIHSMFIYENLSQWLCSTDIDARHGVYAVNSRDIQRTDLTYSKLIVALPESNPSRSIIDRIGQLPAGVSRIWTGIPHPAIDTYALSSKMTHNYQYVDFLRYNDKLQQKAVFGDVSPSFFKINTQKDLDKAVAFSTGYIKSSIGAGGFSVLSVADQADKIKKKAVEIISGDVPWYYEQSAMGTPQSVQVYKKGDRYTMFGHAEQYVEGTSYVGARLLDVYDMDASLVAFLQTVCERINPFLATYEGFFGIDIMVDESEVYVLELNVRLTATTIPTLVVNNTGKHEKVEYLEEIPLSEVQENDVILTESADKRELCVLRIADAQDVYIGKSSFIQLVKCEALPPKLEGEFIEKIKVIIAKNVSAVVGVQVKNFWPYGWTLSFILAESHCVMSSWHLQKNIFIDIFCCTDIDTEQLLVDLCAFFEGSVAISESVDRYSI